MRQAVYECAALVVGLITNPFINTPARRFVAANGTISGLSFRDGAAVTENSALRDAGGVVWSASAITDLAIRDNVGVWRNEAQERGGGLKPVLGMEWQTLLVQERDEYGTHKIRQPKMHAMQCYDCVVLRYVGFAHSNGNLSDVVVAGSSLYSNRAGALGGVFSAADTLRNLSLTAATHVHDNVVTGRLACGGVVSAGAVADVAVNGGSTVWSNTASGAGGVIHCIKTLR